MLAFLARNRHPHGLTHAVLAVPTECHTSALAALPNALCAHPDIDWPSSLPAGFHRLDIADWVFTICVGPIAQSVGEWCCAAQHLWVGGEWPWGHAQDLASMARSLARHCALHASLSVGAGSPVPAADWAAAGFIPASAAPGQTVWQYQPRWPVRIHTGPGQRTALVIGAGLAGAATCASLTRRGWHVTLLDSGSGPAQGASGLPVGMLSEHITANDTALSRLSRSGVAAHWRELQRRVPQGQGWSASLVANLRHAADDDEPTAGTAAATAPVSSQRMPVNAAIVRPAVLVEAWLSQARGTGRLQERWNSPVARLEQTPQGWRAVDRNGHVLAQAAHVVVAAAHGSAALLCGHGPCLPSDQTLRPVKGQLSFGSLAAEPLAAHPVRDHGVYVPCFEDSTHPNGGRLWAMGSTYERGQIDTTVTAAGHDRNAASLASTLPSAHALFEAQRAAGELQGWAQVRCASQDRLPMAGPLPDASPLRASMQLEDVPRLKGAWTLCALGSRGLTLSMLGSELLAAQMENEPWPIEKSLGLALDPARFALKSIRKNTAKSTSSA